MIQKVVFMLAPSEKGFTKYGYTFLPPLSLGILAGYLKNKGLEVGVYDLNMDLPNIGIKEKEQFSFLYDRNLMIQYLQNTVDKTIQEQMDSYAKDLLSKINIEDWDMVGISCGADFSFFQLHSAFILAAYIKKVYHKPITIGGNNITYLLLFQEVFHDLIHAVLSNFPYVMKGPGEYITWQLIEALNQNTKDAIYSFDGFVYLKDKEICINQEHEPLVVRPNWCNLPMDYYYLKVNSVKIPSVEHNKAIEEENRIHVFKWPFYLTQFVSTVRKKQKDANYEDKLVLPYIFNFHCPYACAFCSESDEDRKTVILGKVDEVVNDLIHLKNQYQTNYFYFFNNAINASATFMDELCKRLIEQNVHLVWSDCARFNTMTYERLKLLKAAGCVKLVFGFETASEKLIDLVEKKIDLAYAEQVMKWCNELGIWTDLEVIIGLPQEQEEDFMDTVNYVIHNKEYINYMSVNEFFVVPSSKIGRNPQKYNIELIKNVIDYDKILKRSWEIFLEGSGKQTGNFKIYKFQETHGRDYREIARDNRLKMNRMKELQRTEFTEVEGVFKILDRIATKTESYMNEVKFSNKK